MSNDTMKEGFIDIDGIPTHIMTRGKWIEESLDGERELIICITGNPGLIGYYNKFLSSVHKNLDPKIPIWVIGHAGHNEPPKSSDQPPLSGNESKYNLEAQVKHKIAFIDKYAPSNVKIHLIGHSIGSWMILQLLKESKIKDRIQKCYLLFPTLERMSESWNGRFFTIIFERIFFILAYLNHFLHMLPVFVRVFCIYIYFWLFTIPRDLTDTTLLFIRPSILDLIVFLGKDEVKHVNDLNIEIIKENVNLLKFYYGTTDGWVPVRYYEELKQRVPGVDATLDNRKISHCFVLRESTQMAEIIVDWINENRVPEKPDSLNRK